MAVYSCWFGGFIQSKGVNGQTSRSSHSALPLPVVRSRHVARSWTSFFGQGARPSRGSIFYPWVAWPARRAQNILRSFSLSFAQPTTARPLLLAVLIGISQRHRPNPILFYPVRLAAEAEERGVVATASTAPRPKRAPPRPNRGPPLPDRASQRQDPGPGGRAPWQANCKLHGGAM